MIKRNRFDEEEWKIRKKVLKEMIAHEFYDYYGCYDSMKELAEKPYVTDAEVLKFADMLNEYDHYAREAANLYRQ